MSIEIIHERENEKDKTAFFKLTMNGEVFEWHGDIPKDAEAQSFLEAQADKLKFLVILKHYHDADYKAHQKEDMTDLQAIKKWIKAGCENKVQIGMDDEGKPIFKTQVIEKRPWRGPHPKEVTVRPLIEKAKTVEEIKEVLQKML